MVPPDVRYRLAPVRDSRARDEQLRRGDLAAAAGAARDAASRLDAARARTEAARAELARAIAARDALLATATTTAKLVTAERFAIRCRGELGRALAAELRAEAAHDNRLGSLDVAQRTLARARADREVIERHFASWRQAQQKLAERRED